MKNVLSELIEQGYGYLISEFSKRLGDGLWSIEIGRAQLSIFENGLRYKNDKDIEVSYSSIIGIKSFMTVELISNAQNKGTSVVAMKFECNLNTYTFDIPIVIYSDLLGYFCDQVKLFNNGEIKTGFN